MTLIAIAITIADSDIAEVDGYRGTGGGGRGDDGGQKKHRRGDDDGQLKSQSRKFHNPTLKTSM